MSKDKFILSEWEKEKMDKLKELARLEDAENEGHEKGFEKGIEKGLEQGIEQGIELGIKEGIKEGELIDGDSSVMASGIFGFTCSTMVYKLRHDQEIEIPKIYKEIEKDFIIKLKKQ